MQDRYEKLVLVQQLINLTGALTARSGLREKLADWFCDDGGASLGVIVPEYDEDAKPPIRRMRHLAQFGSKFLGHDKKTISVSAWRELGDVLRALCERLKTSRKSLLQKNIEALAHEVGFDPTETVIFAMAVRIGSDDIYKSLCEALFNGNKTSLAKHISVLLKLRTSVVSNRLRPLSSLAKSGLIKMEMESWHSDFSDYFEISTPILKAIQPPNKGIRDIERAIFGAPCQSTLQWKDFEHLGEQRDFISALISGAVQKKEKGINILLYGIPGTGKTEFCKALANHQDLKMHAIGETSEDGEEPSRRERIAALRLSDLLLARHKGTLILFDEMEDLTDDVYSDFFPRKSSSSKVFLNRLLEENAIPTLWTCNEIDGFDPALLRRMSLVIEFKVPPRTVRERIWKNTISKHKLKLSQAEISDLARTVKGPPSMITNAVRTAKLAKGGEKQIRLSLKKMARVTGQSVSVITGQKGEPPFNQSLMNADQNLLQLTNRIGSSSTKRNFSLCMYGPAGTGKSAYVRYLADKMDMEVHHKRASDLTSMWVGQTEKNIATAFEDAAEQQAFLIFDEADSLLRNRELANQSWEVSHVNEMLTWMESHPLPFACTTNLMSSLDPASLRRFTFKINCKYLTPDQNNIAFQHFFELPPPIGLEKLSALTPGDFSVVHRMASITGQSSNAQALLEMLQQECAIKPSVSKPIGFGATI